MVRDNIGMLAQVPQGLVQQPEWSAVERLAEIAVPTLAIWGDRDDRNVRAGAARLAADVPGARSLVLPGVDHFVPMRAPEIFTREALAFLTEAATERLAAAGTEPTRRGAGRRRRATRRCPPPATAGRCNSLARVECDGRREWLAGRVSSHAEGSP